MENVGFEPSTVHGTIHGPGCSGSGGIGADYSLPDGQALSDAFQRHTPADLGGRTWVFDKPYLLILNLAAGGYWPPATRRAARRSGASRASASTWRGRTPRLARP